MADCALIIGINDFLNWDSLKFAENDATAFLEIALSRTGFNIKEDNIAFLIGSNASYSKIDEACSSLNQKLNDNDRVIVFCASHGKSQYGTPFFACYDSDSFDNSKSALVESDCRMMDVIHLFRSLLNTKNDLRVLVFFDFCSSSYSFTGRGEKQFDDQIINASCKYLKVFAAAKDKQTAYEDDEYQHGCWTYYLLCALEGKNKEARYANRKYITFSSLINYLSKSVSKRIQDTIGEIQNPTSWGINEVDEIIIDFSSREEKEMEIKKIYFGEVDASDEIESVPDEMRGDLYYDLGNVKERIVDSIEPIMLISGNKGTGKTFLGEYLSYSHPDTISYFSISSIKAADLDKFSKDNSTSEKEKGRYEDTWKYLFYVLMIRELIRKKVPQIEELKEFLSSVFEEKTSFILDDPIAYKTFVFSKRIKQGIKAPKGYEAFGEGANALLKLETLVLAMSSLIKKCTPKKFYLLLDGFDNDIRGTLQDNQLNQFLDLINACKDCQKKLSLFKCILFFRHDILDQLGGLEANLNKELTGKQIVLSWLPTGIQNDPLYSFIEMRYNLNEKRKGYEGMSRFSDVFSGSINKMQKWEWLKELTTYTPRDVIAFFKNCKEVADDQSTVFTEDIMWDATKGYAKYLWSEFLDVLGGTELADKDIHQELETLFSKLGKNCTPQKPSLPLTDAISEINSLPHLKSIGAKRVLEILYDAGMIAVIRKAMLFWKFRESPISFSAVNLSTDKFQIHKGLWKKIRVW